MLAPIDETGGDKEPLNRYVRNLDSEAEDIEAGRLLYVAATRARSRLHLLGCMKVDEHGVVTMPARRSLLGIAWRALSESTGLPAPSNPESADGQTHDVDRLRRLPADLDICAAPEPASWDYSDRELDAAAQIEFSWVGETARHIGSVVHRWLQRIAEDEMRGWDRARLENMRKAFRDELRMHGIPESEIDAATTHVVSALANSLEDPRGRWLLGPQKDAKNEFRITALIEGERRNLLIDRTFIDSEGKRHIVDGKTSRQEGADAEGFLDQERERYRQQLERYAIALGADDSDLGLYFPLLSGWREWKKQR